MKSMPPDLRGVRFPTQRLATTNGVEVAALISNAFPLSSPHSWARALGIESNMTSYLTGYLCDKDIISNSLGIGNADGALIGACILETHSLQPSDEEREKLSRDLSVDDGTYSATGAIDGILDACKSVFYRELHARHLGGPSSFDPSARYGYVSWIATDAAHRGEGIALDLASAATARLRDDLGCRLAVAFTVSPTATRLFGRAGYSKWGQVTYGEFAFKGQRPFRILPDEVSVMVQELQ